MTNETNEKALNEIKKIYSNELNRVDEDFDWGEETYKILKKYGVI